MPVLERTQTIHAPLDRAWTFFSEPANLARITPSWLRFRIHGEAPAQIAAGARLEYRIRWLVFRLRWVTRITRFDPPREFQDVQERGPYRTWVHTHTFEPDAGGGVRMRDRVDYALPFGPLGRLANGLVRRQLGEVFDYRCRAIENIFGAPGAAA